ncbi:TRAP transporter small permease [Flavimaricola marinus]|uniref:TRAP transporter small permease protein n=1 Tax=Flavimaricola marinus TaxID=1819565 RepID=A0A238LJC8_9RHOB|nr:TRAP transporter small permease [Flavimaricola marinus]SMY09761.1 Tripartite ATP-independent periplasmic transporters, DctQ component [Flavimaricola marinus]
MIGTISDWINRATFFVAALLLIFLVALVILAVVMRYAIGQPLVYSYDLSTLLFAWTVFLGLSLAEHKGAHLSIIRPEDFVGPRTGRAIEIVRLTALLAISLGTLWFGVKLLGRAVMVIPSMRISIGWLYASLPIGFGLLSIEYFLKLLIAFSKRGGAPRALAAPQTGHATLFKDSK